VFCGTFWDQLLRDHVCSDKFKMHAELNKNIKNIFIEEQIANVHHVLLWCMMRMCCGAW
jgi:hypothetical protein